MSLTKLSSPIFIKLADTITLPKDQYQVEDAAEVAGLPAEIPTPAQVEEPVTALTGKSRVTNRVRPTPVLMAGAGLGTLGNYMASNVSGGSDPAKAALSILAGTAASYLGLSNILDSAARSGGTMGQLLMGGATLGGGIGGSYLTRRLLDRFDQAEPDDQNGQATADMIINNYH